MTTYIDMARDFTAFPMGRYRSHGPYSGERFREEFLWPPLSRGEPVEVNLDSARGLSSSFLEEAFGGLIRRGIKLERLKTLLTIVADRDPTLQPEIEQYLVDESRRR